MRSSVRFAFVISPSRWTGELGSFWGSGEMSPLRNACAAMGKISFAVRMFKNAASPLAFCDRIDFGGKIEKIRGLRLLGLGFAIIFDAFYPCHSSFDVPMFIFKRLLNQHTKCLALEERFFGKHPGILIGKYRVMPQANDVEVQLIELFYRFYIVVIIIQPFRIDIACLIRNAQ